MNASHWNIGATAKSDDRIVDSEMRLLLPYYPLLQQC